MEARCSTMAPAKQTPRPGVSFDKLVIDVRFTLGLTNIINDTGKADLGPNADAKNRSFALTVGWRFR